LKPSKPYYPLFLSLEGRVCLVVGGGRVGERKIRRILECGGGVRIVARELTPWLEVQRREKRVAHVDLQYGEEHLRGVDLVFAATSDNDLNRRVAEDARSRRLWCNMATDPETGSFVVPSVLRRGPLAVAVSTSGLSPALARKIRESLEDRFGPEWKAYLELMGRLRALVQSKGLDTRENQRLFREISGLSLLRHMEGMEEEGKDRVVEAVHRLAHPWVSKEELSLVWSETWKTCS